MEQHQQYVQNQRRIITCPNNHILVQTKDLDPYINTNDLSAEYTCNSCQIQFSRQTSGHLCVVCKFDLCQECYEIQPEVKVSCPSGHILYKINTPKMINIENRTAYCKKCKKFFDKLSECPTSCFKCKYDICELCSFKYQNQVSHPYHLLRYEEIGEKPNYPMGTCRRLHPLVHIKEPGPKISPICCFEVQESYVCKACNYDFDSGSRQVSLYSCKTCSFDLCSDCSRLSEALNFRCSRGHKLFIVKSVKEFSSYPSNRYRCNCCSKECDADVSPSCHCKICRTDLCPQCCASYQLLVGQKEQKMEEIFSVLKKEKQDLVLDEDQKEDSFERLKDKEDSNEKLKKKNPAEKVIEKENYVDEFSKKRISVERSKEKEESKEEEKKEWKEEVACIVCLDSARTHVFTPCNHLCVCEGCSADIIKKKSGCPICRVDIQGTVKIFMS